MEKFFIPSFERLNKSVYPRALPPSDVQKAKNVIFENKKVKTRKGYVKKGTNLPLDGIVLKLDEYERIRSNDKTIIALTTNNLYEYSSAKELWETIVSAYNDGDVQTPYSIASSDVFYNVALQNTASCSPDVGKVAIAYEENSGTSRCKIGSVNADGVFTYGNNPAFIAGSGGTSGISITKIDTDKIAISFIDDTDNLGKCVIGTISGLNVTFGSVVTFSGTNTVNMKNSTCITSPNADKIVIIYKETTTTNKVHAIAATISGTVPTFGTAVSLNDSTTNSEWCVTTVNTGKIALGYSVSPAGALRARIATIIGTSIVLYTETTPTGGTTSGWDIVSPNTDTVTIVSFDDYYNNIRAYSSEIDISNNLDFSGGVNLFSIPTGVLTELTAVSPDEDYVAVAFPDTDNSDQGTVVCYRADGTTITPGDSKVFNAGNKCNSPSITTTAMGRICIAFEDDDASDFGKIHFMDWSRVVGLSTSWVASWPNNQMQIKFGTDDPEDTGSPEDVWYTISDFISATALRLSTMYMFEGVSAQYIIKVVVSGGVDDYWDSANMLEGLTTSDENWMILTNGVDPVLRYNGSNSQPLLSTPSRAKYCIAYEGFLFLGHCTDSAGNILPQSLYWSSRGDPTDWVSADSDYIDLIEGTDYITGLEILNGILYVFKERSITQCRYTGQVAPAFDFKENLSDNIGAKFGRTIVNYGEFIIFFGDNDVYLFQGFKPTPIGEPIIKDLVDNLGIHKKRMFAIGIPEKFLYVLFVPTGFNTYPDTCYVYNYRENSWTKWNYYNTMTAGKLTRADTILLGDESGNVYEKDFTATDDNGEDIDSYIITGDLSLNDPDRAFLLLSTIISIVDGTGIVEIAPSFNFGTTYETAIQIDIDVADEVAEHVQNWMRRADRVNFKISGFESSYFEIENLLIHFKDAGVSLGR